MIQSVYNSLQDLLSLETVNSTSQFGIISKITNVAFDSFLQITDKNMITEPALEFIIMAWLRE